MIASGGWSRDVERLQKEDMLTPKQCKKNWSPFDNDEPIIISLISFFIPAKIKGNIFEASNVEKDDVGERVMDGDTNTCVIVEEIAVNLGKVDEERGKEIKSQAGRK